MWKKQRSRFYHEKRSHPLKNICISAILFCVVCALFSEGVSGLSKNAGREQKAILEDALWRGITQYYTLEGRYPENLEELLEETGIQYDTGTFWVDYQIAGANILPDIAVIERTGGNGYGAEE